MGLANRKMAHSPRETNCLEINSNIYIEVRCVNDYCLKTEFDDTSVDNSIYTYQTHCKLECYGDDKFWQLNLKYTDPMAFKRFLEGSWQLVIFRFLYFVRKNHLEGWKFNTLQVSLTNVWPLIKPMKANQLFLSSLILSVCAVHLAQLLTAHYILTHFTVSNVHQHISICTMLYGDIVLKSNVHDDQHVT